MKSMRITWMALFFAFLITTSAASAFGQAFDASVRESERTRVLVLGVPHLDTLGRQFSGDHLQRILSVLEAFRPDVICVESIPPDRLADMILRREDYGPVIDQFGASRVRFGQKMQEHLELTWPEAQAAAKERLEKIEDAPGPGQRAAAVPYLIAAYDDLTALLQWSYLSEAARKDRTDTPASLITYLDECLKAHNERISIGVALARKLGLERIHYIDDHHDKDLYFRIVEDLVLELKGRKEFESLSEDPFFKNSQERQRKALEAGDLYPYFRFINSQEYGRQDAALQWDIWLKTRFESGLDRTRLALWEVRNLNMASHIRRATALHPKGKALVIVGVGHKPFLEAYLRMMSDLKLVQFNDLSEPK